MKYLGNFKQSQRPHGVSPLLNKTPFKKLKRRCILISHLK